MFKFSQFISRSIRQNNRLPCVVRLNSFSSPSQAAELKSTTITAESEDVNTKVIKNQSKPAGSKVHSKGLSKIASNNNIVAAAFASLHSDGNGNEIKTPYTDHKIEKATTIDELLSISDGNGVSRKHAFKVLSVLAEWMSRGRVKLADFESDHRFIRLCKILTKGAVVTKPMKTTLASRSEDLATILSVTADDEAAKLVASITLPQMVKVMTTLTQKKRRSTLLLRSLAYNITASQEKLDVKQSADLLFNMVSLSFPDENLLTKITTDVCAELDSVKKSAVVGSIITSIGLLKYKNPEILDALCEWMLKNYKLCRPQDIFSLFITLAVVNYRPSNADNFFQELIPQLNEKESGKPQFWLDLVWSLVLLNVATEKHIDSVLNQSFLNKIQSLKETSPAIKLKLLNIDGAAEYLFKDYKENRLPKNSDFRNAKIGRTKDKNELVMSMVDALRNLIPSENCLRTDVNTGLGFFIDAECLIDKKLNSLPLDKDPKDAEASRLALMVWDYHDMCIGDVEPTGINQFINKILTAQGYKVIPIPYTDFKVRDKIVFRVQYLQSKLKSSVQ